MLVHVLGQRNEAWHEEDTLRTRQLELEQQLANAEEYSENLHEEIHQLHNQLHPHHLPGAAELADSKDEMDEDPEIEALLVEMRTRRALAWTVTIASRC